MANQRWLQNIKEHYLALPESVQKHSHRVKKIAAAFSEYLMKEQRLAYLEDADTRWISAAYLMGSFMNIGMAAVSEPEVDSYLISNHTILGGYMLREELIPAWKEPKHPEFQDAIAQCCLYHHEKWDGTGYPYGLKGKEIPFYARLLAICDAFVYLEEGGLSQEQAVGRIAMDAGLRFDPLLTEFFCYSKGMDVNNYWQWQRKAELARPMARPSTRAEVRPAVQKPVKKPASKSTNKPVKKSSEESTGSSRKVASRRSKKTSGFAAFTSVIGSWMSDFRKEIKYRDMDYEEEMDEEPEEEIETKRRESKDGERRDFLGDFLFYGFLIVAVMTALLFNGNDKGPSTFAGYGAFSVMTESMQDEIPKGSLVITKSVAASELEVGDDITYMANQTTSVTHRIVKIEENYSNTGYTFFQTKGTMNASPDQQLVSEVNIVGKVVFHSYILGVVMSFFGTYWPGILFGLVLLAVLIIILRRKLM